jgi:hypothetical protein
VFSLIHSGSRRRELPRFNILKNALEWTGGRLDESTESLSAVSESALINS